MKILRIIRNFFIFWLPALAWAAGIYYVSSGGVPNAGPTYWTDFVVKKTAHILEYGIFAVLFFRAFKNSGMGKKEALVLSFILSIIYAATDELHQIFTPGRHSALRDVIFDTIGAGAGLYVIWKLLPKMPKKLNLLAEKLHLN